MEFDLPWWLSQCLPVSVGVILTCPQLHWHSPQAQEDKDGDFCGPTRYSVSKIKPPSSFEYWNSPVVSRGWIQACLP